MADDEAKDKDLITHIHQQEEEIDRLKDEPKEWKARLEDHSKDTDLLKSLYEQGYIDLNGNTTFRKSDMR